MEEASALVSESSEPPHTPTQMYFEAPPWAEMGKDRDTERLAGHLELNTPWGVHHGRAQGQSIMPQGLQIHEVSVAVTLEVDDLHSELSPPQGVFQRSWQGSGTKRYSPRPAGR